MTTRVTIKSKTGSDIPGELAEPSGSDKAPSVVVVQEWWGVNDHIRDLTDRVAKEGFLVFAPDLYRGKATKDPTEASQLMNELDLMTAVQDVGAAVAYLKDHPRGNGKVGVMGFCMGGAVTLASACHLEGISAAVPFYGMPSADKVDYAKVTAPIMMHVAKRDEWVRVAKAEALDKEINDRGQSMVLHVYDADHAFVNDTRPEVYDKANAKLAWDRTMAFFRKHLA